MQRVVLVVDAEVDASQQQVTSSPTIERMVAALRQAILVEPAGASTSQPSVGNPALFAAATPSIQVFSVSQLIHLEAIDHASLLSLGRKEKSDQVFFCPLTLNLPNLFTWPGQTIYQQCREVDVLRQLVEQQFAWGTGDGYYWLPIVLTARGPLYGEVIALAAEQGGDKAWDELSQFSFCQPLHVSDVWRQPLYELGFRLLRSLAAPPATYLLQFGFQGQTICFDRLWPFPAAPAIASLHVQTPDLFACHWLCLTRQPIRDLVIAASAPYQVLQSG
ncbi:MAG TPA: hypothetical protein V6C63_14780 [Allocoleopsis sp.]